MTRSRILAFYQILKMAENWPVLEIRQRQVVKRAGKGGGGWQLVSDHPRWPDVPWPGDAAIIGEVRWMAREL